MGLLVCTASVPWETLHSSDLSLPDSQTAFIVHLLTWLSVVNAIYTFYRTRHYRLFEASIDTVPSTPSAQRVRVDSSPISSSPLRFLSTILDSSAAATSRAHPDPARDVWELAIWDPTPLSLRLFCLFSPGHVLVYYLFLPTSAFDTQPSLTVLRTLFLAALLSAQLLLLQSSFTQQAKDTSLVHKEVQHEYDTKFVHPRLNPSVRDVGTQCTGTRHGDSYVEAYSPTTVQHRAWKPNPNPNYLKFYDPDGTGRVPTAAPPPLQPSSSFTRGDGVASTGVNPLFTTPLHQRDFSSPLKPRTAIRQPQFHASTGTSTGDGGSLGVYTHANSPLKKSMSTNMIRDDGGGRARSPIKRDRGEREASPLKRSSLPPGQAPFLNGARFGHLAASPRRESGRF